MPAENGYSRALPIRWLPAFTEKSEPVAHAPQKEWEAAVSFCSVVGMGLLALAAGRLPPMIQDHRLLKVPKSRQVDMILSTCP